MSTCRSVSSSSTGTCSLAQRRLAAEAKPPSQALWRGTSRRTAVDDALRRVAHSCYRPDSTRSTTQSRIRRRGARADKHLVAEDRFPRALLDNIGVLFEEGTDLLLDRDGLARKDPSLSLLDDFVQQLQIVGSVAPPRPGFRSLRQVDES